MENEQQKKKARKKGDRRRSIGGSFVVIEREKEGRGRVRIRVRVGRGGGLGAREKEGARCEGMGSGRVVSDHCCLVNDLESVVIT